MSFIFYLYNYPNQISVACMREFTDGALPLFDDVAMARVSISNPGNRYTRRGLSTPFSVVGFAI